MAGDANICSYKLTSPADGIKPLYSARTHAPVAELVDAQG